MYEIFVILLFSFYISFWLAGQPDGNADKREYGNNQEKQKNRDQDCVMLYNSKFMIDFNITVTLGCQKYFTNSYTA